MRLVHVSAAVMVVALSTAGVSGQQPAPAQPAAGQAASQDADRKVAGGGVLVKGWQGKADSGNRQGLTVNDSKFAAEGAGFRITTGPAGIYWNPSNTAKGDYTVKATLRRRSRATATRTRLASSSRGKLSTATRPTICIASPTGTETSS
jgi:hypothetical protein